MSDDLCPTNQLRVLNFFQDQLQLQAQKCHHRQMTQRTGGKSGPYSPYSSDEVNVYWIGTHKGAYMPKMHNSHKNAHCKNLLE